MFCHLFNLETKFVIAIVIFLRDISRKFSSFKERKDFSKFLDESLIRLITIITSIFAYNKLNFRYNEKVTLRTRYWFIRGNIYSLFQNFWAGVYEGIVHGDISLHSGFSSYATRFLRSRTKVKRKDILQQNISWSLRRTIVHGKAWGWG